MVVVVVLVRRRGGGWRGVQAGRHAFSLKAAIGRTVHCLGLDQKSVNIIVPQSQGAQWDGGAGSIMALWKWWELIVIVVVVVVFLLLEVFKVCSRLSSNSNFYKWKSWLRSETCKG